MDGRGHSPVLALPSRMTLCRGPCMCVVKRIFQIHRGVKDTFTALRDTAGTREDLLTIRESCPELRVVSVFIAQGGGEVFQYTG